MKCPECGGERNCLTCRFSKETHDVTVCLKDHYGVTVGEGCADWGCRKCALRVIEELSGTLKRMSPSDRKAFLDAAERRPLFGHEEKVKQ